MKIHRDISPESVCETPFDELFPDEEVNEGLRDLVSTSLFSNFEERREFTLTILANSNIPTEVGAVESPEEDLTYAYIRFFGEGDWHLIAVYRTSEPILEAAPTEEELKFISGYLRSRTDSS